MNSQSNEKKQGLKAREVLVAGLALGFILGVAVSSHYIEGRGLFKQAIWDPVGIYIFYPGDQVVIDAFHAGHLPLWDASRGLGTPHEMPIFATAEFPLKVLAYLINSDAGWEFYILARLWLAGLFCFMAARELPLGFRGSFFAGLAFMLCGYFREFQNMPDISVALMMPLELFLLVRLAKRQSLGWFLALTASIQFLDSNPESTIYAIAYMGVFYLAACLIEARRLGRPLASVVRPVLVFAVIVVFGFFIEIDTIFPVAEIYTHGWTFHPQGIGQIHVPLDSAIALVTPVFDYWMAGGSALPTKNLEQLTVLPAYLGIAVTIPAAFALSRPKRLPPLGLAVAVLGLVVGGVVFGIFPFSLLARLPLVNTFQNFRYLQPFLALCVALLAGMGLEAIIREPARAKEAAALVAVIALWIAFHLFVFRHHILHSGLVLGGLIALASGMAAIGIAAFVISKLKPERRRAALAWAFIAASAFELCLYFNLARPAYGPNAFPTKPPAGIRQIRKDFPARITATDQGILHPNLAEANGLADVRDMSPMYVKDYVSMISKINGYATEQETADAFLKNGRFYFDLDLARVPPRLLDELNVRYVLSYGPPGAKPLASGIEEAGIVAPAKNYVSLIRAELGGRVVSPAILSHAPSFVSIARPQNQGPGKVLLEAAMLKRTEQCENADGAAMMAIAIGAEGNRLDFARTLYKGDKWLPADFKMKAGEKGLDLISLPGPDNDNRCDFAVWSAPLFTPGELSGPERLGLDLIYDREVRIYENRYVMQRVFTARTASPCGGLDDCLSGLVEGNSARAVRLAGIGKEEKFAKATVSEIKEGHDRLSFTAQADGQGLAVISNLYFPGWRAWVNGKERKIARVNGVMQGVPLEAGQNRVELAYYPYSYRVSMWPQLMWLPLFALALAHVRKGWRP